MHAKVSVSREQAQCGQAGGGLFECAQTLFPFRLEAPREAVYCLHIGGVQFDRAVHGGDGARRVLRRGACRS